MIKALKSPIRQPLNLKLPWSWWSLSLMMLCGHEPEDKLHRMKQNRQQGEEKERKKELEGESYKKDKKYIYAHKYVCSK